MTAPQEAPAAPPVDSCYGCRFNQVDEDHCGVFSYCPADKQAAYTERTGAPTPLGDLSTLSPVDSKLTDEPDEQVAGGAEVLVDDVEVRIEVRTCRKCGCTDEHACEGGCTWVEDDLCSACVVEEGCDAFAGAVIDEPKQCEGCGDTASFEDIEGVPLCAACMRETIADNIRADLVNAGVPEEVIEQMMKPVVADLAERYPDPAPPSVTIAIDVEAGIRKIKALQDRLTPNPVRLELIAALAENASLKLQLLMAAEHPELAKLLAGLDRIKELAS